MSGSRNVLLAVLRNDLRLHDHPIFSLCSDPSPAKAPFKKDITHVLPIYVFDQGRIEVGGLPGLKKAGKGEEARTRTGQFWRCGEHRTRYLTNSVFDVRDSLRSRNSDLSIWAGLPEVVVPRVVEALQKRGDSVEGVWMSKEINTEEVTTEKRLGQALSKLGVRLVQPWDRTLVNVEDLGFPVSELPDVFTSFRKRVEAPDMFREPLPAPSKLKPYADVELEDAAGSYSLSAKDDLKDPEHVINTLLKPLRDNPGPLKAPTSKDRPQAPAFAQNGGETEALTRAAYYLGRGKPGEQYKQTRNGMLGPDYSTKFSAALAHGTISPRFLADEATKMDKQTGASRGGGGYWIVFELLWRDYFHFVGAKYGSKLFTLLGIEEVLNPKNAGQTAQQWLYPDSMDNAKDGFVRWTQGKTGVPLVDANMLELAQTGFMSNRGRQNVASFLTKDLYYDWRLGAEWFESVLADYDPNSNWGNWQYVAGVGNDPRAGRKFNVIKQSKDYDANGDYVKTWLPVLASLPPERVHHPWTGGEPPGDYPHPVVQDGSWKPHLQGSGGGARGARGGRGRGRGRGGFRGRGGGDGGGRGRGQ
ncbi:cryptochrome [Ceraceosorus guamensis]|uniref:Cryptochrome DASH n=1 Tax=Ceraceosorus guamensis TaxID=1522189 RepID=A0A316W8Y8_9BASI|nr:cryptochrome [Ceraceosorus guamensis]PWN46339.1 cryptochrome [Ceraceosorus guamensis]